MGKLPYGMLAALGPLLVGGCTVGENFTPPKADTPTAWHDDSGQAGKTAGPGRVSSEADPDPRWWLSFHDPILSDLIERGTKGNLDVKLAVLRIAEARSNEVSSAAAGLPTLSGKGSYTRDQVGAAGLAHENAGALSGLTSGNSGAGFLNSISKPIDLYSSALDASWEIDLFGKVRRSVEAAGAQTEVAIGNRDDALVTLEAEIASTYARLRGAQASRATAEADIRTEQEILSLTRDRAEHGLVSMLDVQSAVAQLRNSESALPQYDQTIDAALNGLAVLVGEAPGSLDAELVASAEIPKPPPDIPIGLPAELARRRPDIRAAEAQLHEQTASVGVAIAQLYPDISLTGQVGERAERAHDLTQWANNFYAFGPSISLPIFEGGRLQANIELAKTEQAEAAIQYRKTVLNALQDVENALSSYRTEQERQHALSESAAAEEVALGLARERYLHGLSNFVDVLSAENTLISVHQQQIQSTLSVTTDVITLYKALGGGWQQPAADQTPPPAAL